MISDFPKLDGYVWDFPHIFKQSRISHWVGWTTVRPSLNPLSLKARPGKNLISNRTASGGGASLKRTQRSVWTADHRSAWHGTWGKPTGLLLVEYITYTIIYCVCVYIYIVRSIYTYNVMCLYYVVLCVYMFTCTYPSRKWEIKCRKQPTVCPLKHQPRNPVPSGTTELGDSTNCLS
jgi:hypothetical protein